MRETLLPQFMYQWSEVSAVPKNIRLNNDAAGYIREPATQLINVCVAFPFFIGLFAFPPVMFKEGIIGKCITCVFGVSTLAHFGQYVHMAQIVNKVKLC
jgi:hypothetical protein